MILIDTNIFLETALAQNRALECRALLNAVAEGKIEATVTHFSLHAIAAILGKGPKIREFLQAVENSRGLRVHETTVQDEISVAVLSEKMRKDFDDTLQYFAAVKTGAESIVSFDKDFDFLSIPRTEPNQILKQVRSQHK